MPEPAQAEPLMAPPPLEPVVPASSPEPDVVPTEITVAAPEPELPAMAPPEPLIEIEPVQPAVSTPDFFEAPEQTTVPDPSPEQDEPDQLPDIQPVTLIPPTPEPAELADPEWPSVELPAIDLTPPAAEPALPEPVVITEPSLPADPEPTFEPDLHEQFGQRRGTFTVVVRLKDGDGVEVGEFRDFGTAMEGAQEVIEQFSNANGSWPFYAGRFIRPDLIVSVDVLDS
ncbi:MAG: hypothetical protein WBB76_02395 [Gaiellaceae bacterium]